MQPRIEASCSKEDETLLMSESVIVILSVPGRKNSIYLLLRIPCRTRIDVDNFCTVNTWLKDILDKVTVYVILSDSMLLVLWISFKENDFVSEIVFACVPKEK